jgi:hypothetical protein
LVLKERWRVYNVYEVCDEHVPKLRALPESFLQIVIGPLDLLVLIAEVVILVIEVK